MWQTDADVLILQTGGDVLPAEPLAAFFVVVFKKLFMAARPFILMSCPVLSVESRDWRLQVSYAMRTGGGRVTARTEMSSAAGVAIGSESEVAAAFQWQLALTGKEVT